MSTGSRKSCTKLLSMGEMILVGLASAVRRNGNWDTTLCTGEMQYQRNCMQLSSHLDFVIVIIWCQYPTYSLLSHDGLKVLGVSS